MSFIIGEMPYLYGFIRKEYTRAHKDGQGEYYPCIMFGLRVVRGQQLEIQSAMTDENGAVGGAQWLLPIEAYCWEEPIAPRPRPILPEDFTYIQPWDCFSSTFGVHQWTMWRNAKVLALPLGKPGRYHCSLDFAESDLALDGSQHKHLHLCKMFDGSMAAFPNNRLLLCDPAYFRTHNPQEPFPSFLALPGPHTGE